MKTSNSPSKYSRNFCLTGGNTGASSVRYELLFSFVLVSLYLRLYLAVSCRCSFAIATELPHRRRQKIWSCTAIEQVSQSTYNVRLRSVCATIVVAEKQYVLRILSMCFNLRYRACNAHTPYCHLWPVRLYNIFPHYLINGTIFEKVIENEMCVLIFSTTFV